MRRKPSAEGRETKDETGLCGTRRSDHPDPVCGGDAVDRLCRRPRTKKFAEEFVWLLSGREKPGDHRALFHLVCHPIQRQYHRGLCADRLPGGLFLVAIDSFYDHYYRHVPDVCPPPLRHLQKEKLCHS